MRGRPKKYLTEEARKLQKLRYVLNKPWFCDICSNNEN